jgi:hypothetical protein
MMNKDPRTEQILQVYRKDVEKFARSAYLQTLALKKEIDEVRINPEDKMTILIHCINLLTGKERQVEKNTPPNGPIK